MESLRSTGPEPDGNPQPIEPDRVALAAYLWSRGRGRALTVRDALAADVTHPTFIAAKVARVLAQLDLERPGKRP